MYEIINSMPFGLYVFVLLIGLGCLIYSIFDMRKKQPGNPTIWILPFGITVDIMLVVYRLTIEFAQNNTVQDIAKIILIVSAVLFIISIFATFILANKKGYIDSEPLKKIMPTLKGCAIALIIVAILLGVVIFLRDKT